MTYRIEFVKQSAKQLKSISTEEKQRIKIKIDALAEVPRPNGVVKLVGEDSLYRIRVELSHHLLYSG
ncbi:MAG: type II toxin-antitoxin system RelE family toxin [Pseudanabaena sp.]